MYAPEHLNPWTEYAAAGPNLERVFALPGVERHERGKQEVVATLVDVYLSTRAVALPTGVRRRHLSSGFSAYGAVAGESK